MSHSRVVTQHQQARNATCLVGTGKLGIALPSGNLSFKTGRGRRGGLARPTAAKSTLQQAGGSASETRAAVQSVTTRAAIPWHALWPLIASVKCQRAAGTRCWSGAATSLQQAPLSEMITGSRLKTSGSVFFFFLIAGWDGDSAHLRPFNDVN